MITLESEGLTFRFPAVHPDATCAIDFQHTLRIPDAGSDYPLPPGRGRFRCATWTTMRTPFRPLGGGAAACCCRATPDLTRRRRDLGGSADIGFAAVPRPSMDRRMACWQAGVEHQCLPGSIAALMPSPRRCWRGDRKSPRRIATSGRPVRLSIPIPARSRIRTDQDLADSAGHSGATTRRA